MSFTLRSSDRYRGSISFLLRSGVASYLPTRIYRELTKLGVCIATGSAVARAVYVAKAYETGDILYHSVLINLSAAAEQTFGHLVISVPVVPKVLQDFPCAKRLRSLARSRARQTSDPRGYLEQQ
jgi:hypothetical protein